MPIQIETEETALIEEPEFFIDPKLRDYLTGTGEFEDEILRKSIEASGGPDNPLVVWDEENILIAGHRRFAICKDLGLPYHIRRMNFESREDVIRWMLEEQLERRNVQDHDRAILTRRLTQMASGDNPTKVVADVAVATNQSVRNVYRYTAYAKAFEKLTPDWQEAIKTQSVRCPLRYAEKIASLSQAKQGKLLTECMEAGDNKPMRAMFPEVANPPTKAATERKEREVQTLPPDVESAAPLAKPLTSDEKKELDPLKKRIPAMVDEANRAYAAFARCCDAIFSDRGLGIESSRGQYKRSIDQSHRHVAMVLDEIKEVYL